MFKRRPGESHFEAARRVERIAAYAVCFALIALVMVLHSLAAPEIPDVKEIPAQQFRDSIGAAKYQHNKGVGL